MVYGMAKVVYRRGILRWVVAALVAIPVIALISRTVYVWLVPVIPLVGGALLFVLFGWIGFRRRRR